MAVSVISDSRISRRGRYGDSWRVLCSYCGALPGKIPDYDEAHASLIAHLEHCPDPEMIGYREWELHRSAARIGPAAG